MKIGLIFFIICFALIIPSFAGIVGDVNNDDQVDLSEAIHALQVTAGLRSTVMADIYSNATFTGTWLVDDGTSALLFFVTDNIGGVTAHSMFREGTPPGFYLIRADGQFLLTTKVEEKHYIFKGTQKSLTECDISFESTPVGTMKKVSSLEACLGTWSGVLTEDITGTEYTIEFTVNENGIVTSFTGFSGPVSGKMYAEAGKSVGFFYTAEPESGNYNQFRITGDISGSIFSGRYNIDTGTEPLGGNITLTRS